MGECVNKLRFYYPCIIMTYLVGNMCCKFNFSTLSVRKFCYCICIYWNLFGKQ